jgi:hypothetical protein
MIGVPLERHKIMVKQGLLKDDNEWENLRTEKNTQEKIMCFFFTCTLHVV